MQRGQSGRVETHGTAVSDRVTEQVRTAAFDATFKHLTDQTNEPSILKHGLQTARGGQGGIGDALVAEGHRQMDAGETEQAATMIDRARTLIEESRGLVQQPMSWARGSAPSATRLMI